MTRGKVTPSEAPVLGLVKEYYAQRTSTPGTLLVTEGTVIVPKAHGLPGLPGFRTDEQINGLEGDEVHAKGSFIFLQIMALGRDASKATLQARDPSLEVVGAAGDIPYTGGDQPRPLTQKEIQEYIELFVQAAKSAVEKAGFDGVEFLEDVSNNRMDEYGGSIENSARFVLEVVGAIGKAIGIEKTALRLSPWPTIFDMGMKDPIPTYTYLVTKLKELYPNLAYLGLIEPRTRGGDFEERELDERESNEFIQKIWSPRPLVLSGGYTRQTAIEKVETAEGVLIAFGRHFLANPDLPVRLEKDISLNPYDRSTSIPMGLIPRDTLITLSLLNESS
ncbi:FMN-linked oxidoreductase [Dendrothele bispora CBS 962.96]|uniref:FMN-linked oxidoreductase n=1 Tax=Dendrothele bispora (strain CBS 962.96) TaxID=1314807 RepID=A0A4S8KVK4_DENBC|nr:FMN-linked oxidoreductase [Dendrothele bispora CBS 962.96]